MADSYHVRPKKTPKNKTDQKNNRIVGPMWLGILQDLPLFYWTCPFGPTLLGKTVKGLRVKCICVAMYGLQDLKS